MFDSMTPYMKYHPMMWIILIVIIIVVIVTGFRVYYLIKNYDSKKNRPTTTSITITLVLIIFINILAFIDAVIYTYNLESYGFVPIRFIDTYLLDRPSIIVMGYLILGFSADVLRINYSKKNHNAFKVVEPIIALIILSIWFIGTMLYLIFI